MNLRNFWMTTLLLTLGVTSAQAKKEKYAPPATLTPEQNALIKKAIAAEKLTIKGIQQKSPLVQTYIQNMKGDTKLYAVPVSDQYMLQRVDFGKSFYGKSYSRAKPANHLMACSRARSPRWDFFRRAFCRAMSATCRTASWR